MYTLKIYPTKSKKQILYLNQKQQQLFKIALKEVLNLQVGFTTLKVEIADQKLESSPTTLYLSPPAYSDLIHYQGEALWLAFASREIIVLGPTLGLTVSMPTWKNISNMYAIKKRALLALEKGIFFYCFHLSKVNYNDNLAEAYCLNPNTHLWQKKHLPLPQVLYHRSTFPFNRFVNETNPNNPYNKFWLNPEIQCINNTYYFDKWKVKQSLDKFDETKNFQPETTLFNFEELKVFLEKYEFCFVKGNFGREGRQVFRINKAGKHFICETGGSKLKKWTFTDLEILYNFLLKKLGMNLILQQGITLARIDNRPFDIRVLVQKNIQGNWIISALSYRIASPKAVLTNIAAGAQEVCVAPENKFYSNLSLEELNDFCQKVLLALEANYGSLGEVGLDIAIDDKGKIWLLEANSQPSSRGYKEAATEEVCNQIFGLPLDYAKYLVRQRFNSLFNSSFNQQ